VSAQGTATAPTWNPNAKVGGTPGGTGTGEVRAPPPPPPKKDLSKPAGLVGGTNWSCPFPPEADAEQIDHAVAVVMVTVRPDGTPLTVKVVSDPGYGFGRAARICALGRRYTPGLDRDGNPTTSTMPPISVSFVR
jgi:protein TonB